MTTRAYSTVALLGTLVCTPSVVGAAEPTGFPIRPIRVIVPFTAGGGTDLIARLIAHRLAETWGQPVVVDNRPGGGSVIGSELVARSSPDGHTLLLTANPHTTNGALHYKLPYDTLRDFSGVTQIASAPLLLAVHPSLPVSSVADLIAFARAKPEALRYGSSGNGGPQHIAGELFKSMAKVAILHIPYKGAVPANTALLGAEVQIGFTSMLATLGHIKAGKLRALAITGAQRSPTVPEVPTIAEAALPGYEAITWYGLLTRGGTPRPVVAALNAEAVRALRTPEVSERLTREGSVIVGSSPEAFDAFIAREIEKVRQLARQSGMKLD